MERLARLAVQRPVAVTVLAAAVVLLGWISWRGLPLDLLPDLPTEQAKQALREELLEEMGIPLIVDQLFTEYFVYLLLAGLLIPVLLEYRRVKRMKTELGRIF